MSSITPNVIQLRSQNAQALIFKLFDELLEAIFLTLTPSWSSAGYYVGPTKLARSISQVCSRWRKLSLEISGLWQSIELEHRTQDWTEELLRRSVRAPFIEIQSTDIKCFDNILYFPGILPRIRFFQGSLTANGWVQLFNSAQQPGAQLEHLSLDHRSEVEYRRTRVTFHGHTPPLRYMRMPKTDNMHLASPFFSNLRDVNISQPQLSIPYLASVANNMAFLERLQVTADLIIENEHPQPQIHFLHLQYLDYTDQNFLKYVDVPQECGLRATCNWSDRTEAITNITRRLIRAHTNEGNSWLAIYISNSHFRINNNHDMFPSNNTSDELFSYEIQYWPLHGRADVMRMMLEAANKPYKNVFVDPKEWATVLKPKQRFGHIPALIVKYEDGTSATLWEGVAIDLYLAETLGFLPETQNSGDPNFVKSECLGVYTSWLELSDKFSVAMARPTVEERRESVQKLRDDVVRLHVGFHETLLAGSESKGPFYFGNKPTLADFMAVSTSLRMAELLGDDYASVNFPQLVKLKDAIVAIPQVGKYIQKRRNFGILTFDKQQLKVVPASAN